MLACFEGEELARKAEEAERQLAAEMDKGAGGPSLPIAPPVPVG